MENNNPVDQWTNAELVRWMAERDDGLSPRPYPDSLDAAVAWIDRRGLHWSRYQSDWPSVAVSTGIDERPCNWKTCYESPDCPTSRALCIAAVKAQMEVDAKR